MMRSSSWVLRHWCLKSSRKQLILSSYRLRTFEDARPEIVTFVQAKFGMRIRDSKPRDKVTRGQSDPMDVDAVNNSLSSGEGKGSSSPRDGCLKCGGAHYFNEAAMHAKAKTSTRLARTNRASHGPKVRKKEKSKESKGKSKT